MKNIIILLFYAKMCWYKNMLALLFSSVSITLFEKKRGGVTSGQFYILWQNFIDPHNRCINLLEFWKWNYQLHFGKKMARYWIWVQKGCNLCRNSHKKCELSINMKDMRVKIFWGPKYCLDLCLKNFRKNRPKTKKQKPGFLKCY